MGADGSGLGGQERLWSLMDEAALGASDEARRLAREAVSKHLLRPDRFEDPLERALEPGPGGPVLAPAAGAMGPSYSAEEMERILRDFFMSQTLSPRPDGPGALAGRAPDGPAAAGSALFEPGASAGRGGWLARAKARVQGWARRKAPGGR